ncbi:MAG: hypothetical protein O3B72_07905 [Proteobacteria bacterium]|nr:hypothetical protein [Pseudomonadota bacterium]
MIPNTDNALRMLSQRMMAQLLPDLKSNYSISDGFMIGLLVNAIADEMAEGIHRRVEDIEDMRRILKSAPDGLPAGSAALLDAPLEDLRLATVNERHDALTRLLILIQTRAEETDDVTLQAEIWGYLRRHAARHVITAVP